MEIEKKKLFRYINNNNIFYYFHIRAHLITRTHRNRFTLASSSTTRRELLPPFQTQHQHNKPYIYIHTTILSFVACLFLFFFLPLIFDDYKPYIQSTVILPNNARARAHTHFYYERKRQRLVVRR